LTQRRGDVAWRLVGVQRGLIVAKIKPGSEAAVAEIFGESDASELPELAGVVHRSLWVMDDIYIHLVETRDDFDSTVTNIREHPLFVEISRKLDEHIQPYDPETWKSPKDAMAKQFYAFDVTDAPDSPEATDAEERGR